jgi:hypothetical protein
MNSASWYDYLVKKHSNELFYNGDIESLMETIREGSDNFNLILIKKDRRVSFFLTEDGHITTNKPDITIMPSINKDEVAVIYNTDNKVEAIPLKELTEGKVVDFYGDLIFGDSYRILNPTELSWQNAENLIKSGVVTMTW